MFSSVRRFINRHRRKFIVTGIVVGTIVVASRYAQRKLREWQERETREFVDRTRKQQHFESTERTCNQTILSLAPAIVEAILKSVNTEEIVSQLRSGHPDKIALWETLKIRAFTCAAVLMYASVMFVVTLRIQLNLIGGCMFRDSSDASPGSMGVSNVLQEKYLSLCHHFINHGVEELCSFVQNKVQPLLQNVSLKHKLNLQDIEQIFWSLQAAIINDNDNPVKNIAHYMLPLDQAKISDGLKSKDAELLKAMLLETVDILDSDEVSSLSTSLVSHGLSHFVDRIGEYISPSEINKSSLNAPIPATITEVTCGNFSKPSPQKNGIGLFIHPNSVTVPMAKLIPIVDGLTHNSGSVEISNLWIQQLIFDKKLKDLGANIYESFCNKS